MVRLIQKKRKYCENFFQSGFRGLEMPGIESGGFSWIPHAPYGRPTPPERGERGP